MTVTRLDQEFSPRVAAAMEKHAQGENIIWEVAYAPHPEMGVVAALMVWIPAAIVGAKMCLTGMMQPVGSSEEDVDEWVRQFLDSARSQRTQQLQMDKPLTNGDQPH